MEVLKWLEDNTEEGNLCDPEMEPQLALNILKEYLIPGYYCVMPQNTKQVNTDIVLTILNRYSKRFRKEYKMFKKELKKVERS